MAGRGPGYTSGYAQRSARGIGARAAATQTTLDAGDFLAEGLTQLPCCVASSAAASSGEPTHPDRGPRQGRRGSVLGCDRTVPRSLLPPGRTGCGVPVVGRDGPAGGASMPWMLELLSCADQQADCARHGRCVSGRRPHRQLCPR